MRALQAHCQSPTRAWLHVADRLRLFVAKSGVPRQRQLWRHYRRRSTNREHLLDCEIKTHALIKTIWQAVDGTDQRNIAPFPFLRQFAIQVVLRKQAGPDHTGDAAAAQHGGNAELGGQIKALESARGQRNQHGAEGQ